MSLRQLEGLAAERLAFGLFKLIERESTLTRLKPWLPPLAIVAVVMLIGGLLACYLLLSTRQEPPAPPKDGRNWQLVYAEEFNFNKQPNGNELPEAFEDCFDWYDETYQGCSDDDKVWYAPNQVTVKYGAVRLSALSQQTQGIKDKTPAVFPFTSGMVRLKPSRAASQWAGNFGYYEARIMLPGSTGYRSAFWLRPEKAAPPPQFDIMSFATNDPWHITMGNHWIEKGKTKDNHAQYSGPHGSKGFVGIWHTFGLDWEPGYAAWYVDGHKAKESTTNIPESTPMEVILNLGAAAGSSATLSSYMDVDYLRIYALPRHISKAAPTPFPTLGPGGQASSSVNRGCLEVKIKNLVSAQPQRAFLPVGTECVKVYGLPLEQYSGPNALTVSSPASPIQLPSDNGGYVTVTLANLPELDTNRVYYWKGSQFMELHFKRAVPAPQHKLRAYERARIDFQAA